MTQLLQSSWQLQLDRGPNCLIVRLKPGEAGCDGGDLSEQLAELLEQHLSNRLVLEMNEVDLLTSLLLGQLVSLTHHLQEQGGLIRLCGLSPNNQAVLRTTRLDQRLPHYADRCAAVHGSLPQYFVPSKPRSPK